MKIINPQGEKVEFEKSFLIYGETKSGKTSLAMSIAALTKTAYIAFEREGWQDAYNNAPKEIRDNIVVFEPESLHDLKRLAFEIGQQEVGAIVVDGVTEMMHFIQSEIKKTGGKSVVLDGLNGLTKNLTLQSYGHLNELTMGVVRSLKGLRKHLVLTAGVTKDTYETAEGMAIMKGPLFMGKKTSGDMPYQVRGIGYLTYVNGKRTISFQASQGYVAGTNYSALLESPIMESPTFTKIFKHFKGVEFNTEATMDVSPPDFPPREVPEKSVVLSPKQLELRAEFAATFCSLGKVCGWTDAVSKKNYEALTKGRDLVQIPDNVLQKRLEAMNKMIAEKQSLTDQEKGLLAMQGQKVKKTVPKKSTKLKSRGKNKKKK